MLRVGRATPTRTGLYPTLVTSDNASPMDERPSKLTLSSRIEMRVRLPRPRGLLHAVLAAIAVTSASGCSNSNVADGLDLGIAVRAAIAARRLPDGIYLLVVKEPIYFDPSCDGTVSGRDLLDPRPPMFFRIADDLGGLTPIPRSSAQPSRFAATLGRGAAMVEYHESTPTRLEAVVLYDGKTTTDVFWAALQADDPDDARDQATTAITSYFAEPSAGRVVYVDSTAQLRRFEDGRIRTLATVEPGAVIATADASSVVLAVIDATSEHVLLERRSTRDGTILGMPRRIATSGLGGVRALSLPNGTPEDYRVFLGDEGHVLRVTGGTHREERLPPWSQMNPLMGSTELALTSTGGARWIFSSSGEGKVLALSSELGAERCAISRGTTPCGFRAGCARTRTVTDLDGTRGVRVAYTAAYPTDPRSDRGAISLELGPVAARDPSSIPLGTESLSVRVVSLLRPGEIPGAVYSPPPVTVTARSIAVGSTYPIATGLAYGTASQFVTVPTLTSEERKRLRFEAYLANGALLGAVETTAVEGVGRATVVLWLDDTGEVRAAVGEDHADDPTHPVQLGMLVLQSAANEASGNRVFEERVQWACTEPRCRVSMCVEAIVEEPAIGTAPQQLILPAQLGRAVRLTYGAPPASLNTPCPGEVLGEWTYLPTDAPSHRILIVDALAPTGARVLEFTRDAS